MIPELFLIVLRIWFATFLPFDNKSQPGMIYIILMSYDCQYTKISGRMFTLCACIYVKGVMEFTSIWEPPLRRKKLLNIWMSAPIVQDEN